MQKYVVVFLVVFCGVGLAFLVSPLSKGESPDRMMLVRLEQSGNVDIATAMTVLPESSMPATVRGTLFYRLLNSNGRVLRPGYTEDPREVYFDCADENGDLSGGIGRIKEPVSLRLPYHEKAVSVEVHSRRGETKKYRLDGIPRREIARKRGVATAGNASQAPDYSSSLDSMLRSGPDHIDTRQSEEASTRTVDLAANKKIPLNLSISGQKESVIEKAQLTLTFYERRSGEVIKSIKMSPFQKKKAPVVKVPAGLYDVSASCEIDGSLLYPEELHLKAWRTNAKSLDLTWDANTFVKGRVVRSGGGALAARVTIVEQQYNDSTKRITRTQIVTDENGRFSMYLPARALTFVVDPADRLAAGPLLAVKQIKQKKKGKQNLKLVCPTPDAAGGEALKKIVDNGDDEGKLVFIYLSEAFAGTNEPFDDLNGNGYWDGDPLIDENLNNVWDEGERFIDRNANGVWDAPEPFTDSNGDRICNRNERASFELTAAMMTAAVMDFEPFKSYADSFNVYTYWTPSEDGCQRLPEFPEPWSSMNTAWGVYCQRDDYFGDRGKFNLYTFANRDQVTTTVSELIPNYLFWVVLVQDPYDVMVSDASIMQSAADTRGGSVLIHEMGHKVGGLADEYLYGGQSWLEYPYDYDAPQPNRTSITDLSSVKWRKYFDNNTPVPTPLNYDGYGLYEGCGWAAGVYRPTALSMMRSTRYPFFKVNEDALIAVMQNYR